MPIIKNFIILVLISLFATSVNSQEIKKVGKFKDWETMTIIEQTGKVCFAQSVPVLQAPKSNPREARMFVSFRPAEKINDEISVTAGYEFNSQNSITATSGKSNYKFDIAQEGFAWIADSKIENKMISTMKSGSRIMITGHNEEGSRTIDHYSLLGFTKAYNAAKTNCYKHTLLRALISLPRFYSNSSNLYSTTTKDCPRSTVQHQQQQKNNNSFYKQDKA